MPTTSETVNTQSHFTCCQLGRTAQIGYFIAFLVDHLTFKQITVASPLIKINFCFVETATVLTTEIP